MCMLAVTAAVQGISQIYAVILSMKIFYVEIFIELYSYDEEQLYQILLGRPLVTDTDIDTENFIKLCHVHVIQCIAEYNSLPSIVLVRDLASARAVA